MDQQKYFDGLVSGTNCTGASDQLACLRAVPYTQLMAASDHFPSVWWPMVDGKLFQSNPLALVQSGKYAKVLHTDIFYLKASYVSQVPFIAGACEDEGT